MTNQHKFKVIHKVFYQDAVDRVNQVVKYNRVTIANSELLQSKKYNTIINLN